jgi:hypothetical protein
MTRYSDTHRDNLAIGLDQDAVGALQETAEIDRDSAILTKIRIECSILSITRNRKMFF